MMSRRRRKTMMRKAMLMMKKMGWKKRTTMMTNLMRTRMSNLKAMAIHPFCKLRRKALHC